MARDEGTPADRIVLLAMLATLLLVGAMRLFLSSVYYHNLTDLGLNATAAWSLLLLAPVVFFVPRLARRPGALLLAGAIALALGRVLLAPLRGTVFHLPVAGIATGGGLVMLGAMLSLARGRAAALAAGIALGWALDAALLWYGDSADITSQARGLALLLPAGAFVLWLASSLARAPYAPRADTQGGWLAGLAFGAWLFVENTILGNPYGAARWNGAEPAVVAMASVAGLVAGAFLLARGPLPRGALLAVHAALAIALLDHAFLHSPLFPLLVLLGQAAMAVDAALLLERLSGRALVLSGLVALVLHFAFAFSFLYAYVPLRAAWEGNAPLFVVIAAVALLAPLARAALAPAPRIPRPAVLLAAPLLVALAAAFAGGAAIAEPEDAAGGFRVVSFNVHQGFANDGVVDPRAFAELLREEDADIVFLQEADTPRFTSGNLDVGTYLAQTLGYHHVYGQATREQAFGGAILSRFPVQEWRAIELPSASDRRFFTEARIAIDDRDVWVYAVHFTLPRESRLAEIDALLARTEMRSGPVIIAGDLNSCPNGLCPDEENKGAEPDDVYARIAARYGDPWVALGGDANESAAYTYESTRPDQRIDYVFVQDIDVVSYAAVRTATAVEASDHLPVRADLRLR